MTAARIGVLGAGAWGTALAAMAGRAGSQVTLVAREAAEAAAIEQSRENRRYLPGVALDSAIRATADGAALRDCGAVILAVPAQGLRGAAAALADILPAGTPAIIAAKGIERGTALFMSEVVRQVLPQAVPMVLSGPSFAEDVVRGLPTAVVLAGPDEAQAAALARALSHAAFRIYHSPDVRGVEIGGATKNVLAIAAGIVAGRALGLSAQAALTARGFAELQRFARAMGADPLTVTGLSGLGDVILSCAGPQSRNFAYGLALGRGDTLPAKLAEGAATAPVLAEMADRAGVEMPIAAAVAAIVEGRTGIDAAIDALLARPLKAEI